MDEYSFKDLGGVVAAFVSPLAGFVVYPSQHDYLAGSVVAEKQSTLLKELCPEPVFAIIAERSALAIFCSGWILRDDVER